MIKLVAVAGASPSSGLAVFLDPGWTLELSFEESLGTQDEQTDTNIKLLLLQALFDDDQSLEFFKQVVDALSVSPVLSSELSRRVGVAVTLADVAAIIAGKRIADSFSMSESAILSLSKLLLDAFGTQDAPSFETTMAVLDAFSMDDDLDAFSGALFNVDAQDYFEVNDDILRSVVLAVADGTAFHDDASVSVTKRLVDSMMLHESLALVLSDVDSAVGEDSVVQPLLEKAFDALVLSASMTKTYVDAQYDDLYVVSRLANAVERGLAEQLLLDERFLIDGRVSMSLSLSLSLDDHFALRMAIRSSGGSAGDTTSGVDSAVDEHHQADGRAGDQTWSDDASLGGAATDQLNIGRVVVRF